MSFALVLQKINRVGSPVSKTHVRVNRCGILGEQIFLNAKQELGIIVSSTYKRGHTVLTALEEDRIVSCLDQLEAGDHESRVIISGIFKSRCLNCLASLDWRSCCIRVSTDCWFDSRLGRISLTTNSILEILSRRISLLLSSFSLLVLDDIDNTLAVKVPLKKEFSHFGFPRVGIFFTDDQY